jgi:hypothetical protein
MTLGCASRSFRMIRGVGGWLLVKVVESVDPGDGWGGRIEHILHRGYELTVYMLSFSLHTLCHVEVW